MDGSDRIGGALARALERVAAEQRDDGELPVEVRRAGQSAGTPDPTVFATALLLPALAAAGAPRAAEIAAAGRRFLARQAGPGGLVRFWPRGHPRRAETPPDLDDSAAVALELGRPARRLGRLLLSRRDPAGRLPTWLVPRSAVDLARFPQLVAAWPFARARHPFWTATEARPDDADAGANAQALALLGARPETAALASWLTGVVAGGAEESADRWHRAWGVRWLVARVADPGCAPLAAARRQLAARVERECAPLAAGGAAVDVAWALLVGARTGAAAAARAALAERLLAEQGSDGAWPRAALWYGGPRRVVDWGSAAATTALAAGALGAERALRRVAG